MPDRSPPMQLAPPIGVRAYRAVAIPFFRMLYHLLSRPKVCGYENIPERGAYLVTANHLSYYDPPLVLAFWPYQLEALAAAHQMSTFGKGHIMRWYGTHPVQHDSSDLSVLRVTLGLLRAGYPLLIEPEGGRNPTGLREGQPGAAYLATKVDVPIVPVGITGTETIFSTLRQGHRQAVKMVIGPPYQLPPMEGANRKQTLREYTEVIMQQIAALLPKEYQGIYYGTID